MKKTIGKALALALALIMVFFCLSSASFAATKDNITYKVQGKGGYLAIGDSIGMGCGSDGYYLGITTATTNTATARVPMSPRSRTR